MRFYKLFEVECGFEASLNESFGIFILIEEN